MLRGVAFVRSRHFCALPSPALMVAWSPRSPVTWRHRARLRCSRVYPLPPLSLLFFPPSSSSLHLQPPAVKQRHHAPRAERTRASAATLISQSSSSSRDAWRPQRRVTWPPPHEDMKKTPNPGTDSNRGACRERRKRRGFGFSCWVCLVPQILNKYLTHFWRHCPARCKEVLLNLSVQFESNSKYDWRLSDCHPENVSVQLKFTSQLQPTCQTLPLRLAAPICHFFFFFGQLASWLSVLHPGGNPGLPWLLPSDVHHHVSCLASALCPDAQAPDGFGTRHCLPALHSVSFWMFSGSWRLCPSSSSLLLHRDSMQCVHWLLFVCLCWSVMHHLCVSQQYGFWNKEGWGPLGVNQQQSKWDLRGADSDCGRSKCKVSQVAVGDWFEQKPQNNNNHKSNFLPQEQHLLNK